MTIMDQLADDAGIITRPVISISETSRLSEARAVMRSQNVSSLPVVIGRGENPFKLVGILTQRDIRFSINSDELVSDLMTRDRLITVRDGVTVGESIRLIHQFRVERLLVVDDKYNITGMITNSNISRLDKLSDIERDIDRAAANAPIFVPIDGKISHRQKPDDAYVVSERASVAQERCSDLLDICQIRVNEQPELLKIAQEYNKSLDLATSRSGSYRLFVAGLQLEAILQIKNSLPSDLDRNPPLGADLVLAIRALIIAHAGLVSVLPDLSSLTKEFNVYEDQLSALKKISDVKPFAPVLKALSDFDGVFDGPTSETTKKISNMANQNAESEEVSRGIVAVQQAWLRGSLAAMGSFIVTQWRYFKGKLKDTLTSEAIKGVMYSPGTLISTIYVLFQTAKPQLIALADALPAAFGWLRSAFMLLGI